MKAIFVSDIHLKTKDEANSRLLIEFLNSLVGSSDIRPTHFFFLGDIFDLWVADHDYFYNKYKPVADAIHRLVQSGVEVHFFEGNHDFHMKEFFQDRLGVHVHPVAQTMKIAGKRVRIEHGDLINPEDHGYLLLYWFWRNPFIKFIIYNFPERIVSFVGENSSKLSRNRSTKRRRTFDRNQLLQLMRRHAQGVLTQEPYDLLISGHTHLLDDCIIEASGRKGRFINLGSWYEEPQAFVITEEAQSFKLVREMISDAGSL